MAVVQISRIQHRRGLQQDLPQLASAELGFSIDQRRLYIGNGTLAEGAPTEGVTEILTENTDILTVINTYTFKNLEAGIGQIPSGIAVVRTLQSKLDDSVTVRDFGAKGDGTTDDTLAIQRAITYVYSSDYLTNANKPHRAIIFPAGKYLISNTLNIPPFTRIQGAGKQSTIITGYFAGPLARFVDSNGAYGINFGNNAPHEEYHFSDIQFKQGNTSYNQSCLVIDGAGSATFNRVRFSGLTNLVSANYTGPLNPALPIYDVDRGVGIAGVSMTGISQYQAVENVVFTQCDFMDINYGVEINANSRGIAFNNCYFDLLWSYIQVGNDGTLTTATSYPRNITISCSYFKTCAGPGIECYPYTSGVMSLCNSYTGYGQEDWAAYTSGKTPVKNPYNQALYSAIIFNNDDNYSIGDRFESGNRFGTVFSTDASGNITISDNTGYPETEVGLPITFSGNVFGGLTANSTYYVINSYNTNDGNANIQVSTTPLGSAVSISTAAFNDMTYRTGLGFPSVPYVENNGYVNYQLTHDLGLVNGKQTQGRGQSIVLHDSGTFVSAGLTFFPADYKTLSVNYQIEHANQTRMGTLKSSRVSTTYVWDDEFNETGDVGVVLQANITTGDIEYTSTTNGNGAVLTYNLNYFTD